MTPDVNKPLENPKLTSLFKELKNANEDKIKELYELIAEEIAMNAYFLAIFNVDDNDLKYNEDGSATFKENSAMSFELFKSKDNINYFPVYTDWNELKKYEKYKDIDVKTIMLSFDDIYAISNGNGGIVINPFSDNFIIDPVNFKHMKQHKDILLNGISKQRVEKDTIVQIGEPKDYPFELVDAIKNYAKDNIDINAIWLKLMFKDNETSYLLIIDSIGDIDKNYKEIAEVANPYLNNIYLDMVSYNDSFGKKAASGEAFYRKIN